MFRLLRPHSAVSLGLVALSFLAASAILSPTATAKQKPCYEQVIDDWFDDGRVNKIYPLKCYSQAIKNLPPDVLIYGNAEDEIGRALAYAKQGKPDPGGKDPSPTTTPLPPGQAALASTSTTTTATNPSDKDTSGTDTSGPSSVPIPLLVLGGLAVLLLAAGSAGYLRRRMNGDADDDGPATPPPAT